MTTHYLAALDDAFETFHADMQAVDIFAGRARSFLPKGQWKEIYLDLKDTCWAEVTSGQARVESGRLVGSHTTYCDTDAHFASITATLVKVLIERDRTENISDVEARRRVRRRLKHEGMWQCLCNFNDARFTELFDAIMQARLKGKLQAHRDAINGPIAAKISFDEHLEVLDTSNISSGVVNWSERSADDIRTELAQRRILKLRVDCGPACCCLALPRGTAAAMYQQIGSPPDTRSQFDIDNHITPSQLGILADRVACLASEVGYRSSIRNPQLSLAALVRTLRNNSGREEVEEVHNSFRSAVATFSGEVVCGVTVDAELILVVMLRCADEWGCFSGDFAPAAGRRWLGRASERISTSIANALRENGTAVADGTSTDAAAAAAPPVGWKAAFTAFALEVWAHVMFNRGCADLHIKKPSRGVVTGGSSGAAAALQDIPREEPMGPSSATDTESRGGGSAAKRSRS